jgi:hypothetical protein
VKVVVTEVAAIASLLLHARPDIRTAEFS